MNEAEPIIVETRGEADEDGFYEAYVTGGEGGRVLVFSEKFNKLMRAVLVYVSPEKEQCQVVYTKSEEIRTKNVSYEHLKKHNPNIRLPQFKEEVD